MELSLKTIVVPVHGASAYVAVFEWSPTGGMVHIHYILWKAGAPRFDVRAEILTEQREALRRAGWVCGKELTCKIHDVVDFFSRYISEWNPNKTADGKEETSYIAERVNNALPHTASLSEREMLRLLEPGNEAELADYYKRAVRTEHLHDFHYPDPHGPPNPSQPCAQLLKGTQNMWYCKNGYPRDLVCEICQQNIAQDGMRPELWRVNLSRNCPLMNNHVPLATVGTQSNTDEAGVLTRGQAEMYACKYCSKHMKRLAQKSILHEVLDDMERNDTSAQEKYGEGFTPRTLGGKLHRAFMAEIGEEMCQAEVAHHANKAPEYLCSRPEKHVHLYKKALAVSVPTDKMQVDEDAAWQALAHGYDAEGEWDEGASAVAPGAPVARRRLATKPSDLEVYERRAELYFAEGSPISAVLPPKNTPEEQVLEASLWEFFRLVRIRGGRQHFLEWHAVEDRPIVTMSPAIRLAIGADFTFGARWALMQYHAWTDRKEFMQMEAPDVRRKFLDWVKRPSCPWHVRDQYVTDNGVKRRGGAGSAQKRTPGSAKPGDEANPHATDWDMDADAQPDDWDASETEPESSCEDGDAPSPEDTRVLTLLYKGNVAEMERREARQTKAKTFNAKHDYYRNTRCTSVAEEECSALPAGVINVNEDSDDPDEYTIVQQWSRVQISQRCANGVLPVGKATKLTAAS